ncbi:MAG: TlpA family protein disulfide reductase [Pyrinomonadaceae bacterium]|nr:TlpA family protein disulfide reductase [Pyrinomonadaceae bacterium]
MKPAKFALLTLSLLIAMSLSVSAQKIVFASLEGDLIDVEAQADKVVVMAIGASWLPLSNDQADTVNKLAKKYQGRDDVVFYFIATDSDSRKSKNYASNDDIQKFVERNKLNVTILRDNDGKTATERYKLEQLPAFIILDKQGKPDGDPITGIDPFAEVDTADIVAKRVDKLLDS